MNLGRITKFTNYITQPKIAGPAVFLGIGINKTYKDYKKAPDHQKRKTIGKDTAVLLGTTAGYMLATALSKRISKTELIRDLSFYFEKKGFLKSFKNNIKNETIKKAMHKTEQITFSSLEKTEYIVKECIGGVLSALGATIGAVYTNALANKYLLNKAFFNPPAKQDNNPQPIKQASLTNNNPIFQKFDYINPKMATQAAYAVVGSLGDLTPFKLLEKPLVALGGFSIANVDGYDNKLKKTSHDLLANALVPTFFVSIVSLFVKNKHPLIKYPVISTALFTGVCAGKKIADRYQKKIDEQIDKMDMKYISL